MLRRNMQAHALSRLRVRWGLANALLRKERNQVHFASVKKAREKSSDFLEETARRGSLHWRLVLTTCFPLLSGSWSNRIIQRHGRVGTRIERHSTHILNRRWRRAGWVEHERSRYLDVNFVRG